MITILNRVKQLNWPMRNYPFSQGPTLSLKKKIRHLISDKSGQIMNYMAREHLRLTADISHMCTMIPATSGSSKLPLERNAVLQIRVHMLNRMSLLNIPDGQPTVSRLFMTGSIRKALSNCALSGLTARSPGFSLKMKKWTGHELTVGPPMVSKFWHVSPEKAEHNRLCWFPLPMVLYVFSKYWKKAGQRI